MGSSTQILKGVAEGVILKIISLEETYGYEIYQKLLHYGFKEFSEGSLYPLLLRLEKNNYITFIKKQSPLGPDRKYYSLTDEGKTVLEDFEKSWFNLSTNINNLWRE